MKKKSGAKAFAPHDFRASVELLAQKPQILVSREAYDKMRLFVELADKEVGWLGTVRQVAPDFLIEEVFLFKQEVGATTCEISADGLAEFATNILSSREDGMDMVNRLQFWGHSHVNMGTSPSGQDDAQMEVFQENGCPFFIRGILNKNGRMEFAIFLFEGGIKIVDPAWEIYDPEDETLRAEIEAEFAAKVSEIVYPVYQYGAGEEWDPMTGFTPARVRIAGGKRRGR
jgi:hypothetical protein